MTPSRCAVQIVLAGHEHDDDGGEIVSYWLESGFPVPNVGEVVVHQPLERGPLTADSPQATRYHVQWREFWFSGGPDRTTTAEVVLHVTPEG